MFAIQFILMFVLRFAFTVSVFSSGTVNEIFRSSATFTLLFILFIVLYQVIFAKLNNIPIKDLDVNSSQSTTFEVDMSIDGAREAIENVLPVQLNARKFTYGAESNTFKARTRATLQSWGEVIEIGLTDVGNSKTQVSVFSRPVLKTTLIDFGKSALNIHKVRLAFDRHNF